MARVEFPYKIALLLALVYIVSMYIGVSPWKAMAFVLFTGIAGFFYVMIFIAWLTWNGPEEDLLPSTFIAIIFTALSIALFI
jgi:hypothetical protein